MKTYLSPKFIIERETARCIGCQVCVRQCSFGAQVVDGDDEVGGLDENCVGCHRCAIFCPTGALTIRSNPSTYRPNVNWSPEAIDDVKKQAEAGGILLTGMGNDKSYRIYWDHLQPLAKDATGRPGGHRHARRLLGHVLRGRQSQRA
jgi:ferredoxin